MHQFIITYFVSKPKCLSVLFQLSTFLLCYFQALHSAGIHSFKTLEEADPRRIEIITGRKYPFGNHIKESLLSLPPMIEMKIEQAECRWQGKTKLIIALTRLSQSVSSLKRHYADMFVGSEDDNLILFHEKIRAEEFSSPYSATILVSNPQHGKLTLKAALIFEEYVGLDAHEKLVITKESNLRKSRAHGDQQAPNSYSLPKEIYVVEDDDNTGSQVPTEETQSSRKSKREVSSIPSPSFNLLQDDDMDEGVTPVNVEEDISEEVTEYTIFNHIRKKSKNFPVIVTSPNVSCSTFKTFPFTSKPSDEIDTNGIWREILVLPDSDPLETTDDLHITKMPSRKMDELGYETIYGNATPKNSVIFGSRSYNKIFEVSTDNSSAVTDQMETKSPLSDISCASARQRTLLLKEQPISSMELSSAAQVQSENIARVISKSLTGTGRPDFSSENLVDLTDKTAMGKLSTDVIIMKDNGTTDAAVQMANAAPKHYPSARSLSSVGKSELSTASLNAGTARKEGKKLLSAIFSVKADIRGGPCRRASPLIKQQKSSKEESSAAANTEVGEQPSLLATAGKQKEVSFLGFKSVFSFL